MGRPDLAVRTGVSTCPDARAAVREMHDAIAQPDAALTMLFCSSRHDPAVLERELRRAFPGPAVVACSTAGEVTPEGYRSGSITGFSVASDALQATPVVLDELRDFGPAQAELATVALRRGIADARARIPDASTFAALLIDGVSAAEERVIAHLYRCLEGVPLVGGSAADDLRFERTWVYANGSLRGDRAVAVAVTTSLPFQVFKTQHFVPGDAKMVITGAIPERRVVYEIDGETAARAYADILGLRLDSLTPSTFSRFPVMIRIAGDGYVRSIARVNDDESLTFFCAIDEGMVLSTARATSLVDDTAAALDRVRAQVPDAPLVLGFECILRRLEIDERGLADDAGRVMRANRVVGFNTYGEQLNAIHINQTLTGVALGR